MRIPSITQLRSGPPTVDLMTAAAVLGTGRTRAYEMARRGEFPVRVIRIGSTYLVPVAELLTLLGISEAPPVAADARLPRPAATRLLSERTVRCLPCNLFRPIQRPCPTSYPPSVSCSSGAPTVAPG